MKQSGKIFYCKKCGLEEFIPFKQDGITLEQTTKILCPGPKCAGRGKRYKMYEVIASPNKTTKPNKK